MAANFQKIIDRISDAFSFFDFSFLISGMATLAICCYTLNRLGMNVSSKGQSLYKLTSTRLDKRMAESEKPMSRNNLNYLKLWSIQ